LLLDFPSHGACPVVSDEIDEEMGQWEIPEEQMKRNSSQLLLCWFPDTGFVFDLDS